MVEIEYFSPKIRNKVNHLSDKELESRHIKNSQNSIIEEQTFKMSIRFELSQNKICGCQISTWKNASYLQSLRKYKLKLQWDAATYLLELLQLKWTMPNVSEIMEQLPFVQCSRECKMEPPLCETVWQFLTELRIHVLYLEIPLLGIYPSEIKT